MNNKKLMGGHRAGILLNIGMGLAMVFAFIISYNGVQATFEKFQ